MPSWGSATADSTEGLPSSSAVLNSAIVGAVTRQIVIDRTHRSSSWPTCKPCSTPVSELRPMFRLLLGRYQTKRLRSQNAWLNALRTFTVFANDDRDLFIVLDSEIC